MTIESKYLLDSNVIIEPMNRFYRNDICPGFWRLIKTNHAEGRVSSIKMVKTELTDLGKGDEVEKWARKQPRNFFLEPTNEVNNAMTQVADWADALASRSESTKRNFLSGADPWLVAFGIAHGHTIVTMETREPLAISKIKLPDACDYFHIKCINCFEMLRELDERLVRKRKPD